MPHFHSAELSGLVPVGFRPIMLAASRCWSPGRRRLLRLVTQSPPLGLGPRRFGTEAVAHEHPAAVTTRSEAGASRRQRIRHAKPFSDFLTDTFDRQHDYLRISVTERCNLRCLYCMPEEGVPLSPDKELLTTPEIVLLSSIFVAQGVTKIRLTGGEPTVRRDIVPLMRQIGALQPSGLKELCITTNGISLHRKLDSMVEAGLTGVNLSLDTLDPWQFQIMTRRKGFDAVRKSIDSILELNRLGAGIKLKINCVVMRGVNDSQILPFVEMTRSEDIEVRFIEYMPFDGNRWNRGKMLSYADMLDRIRTEHPDIQRGQDHANDTSKTWHVPGFVGRIGFITSMTHNFCGTCNRLRITSDGNLKVCLFGNAEVSLRDILRKSNEAELLDVIGMAVKGKKAKHAGIGELEHMKNRPMILIDPVSASLANPMPAKLWQGVGEGSFSRHWTRPRLYGSLEHYRPFSKAQTLSGNATDGRSHDEQDRVGEQQQQPREESIGLSHVSECGWVRMVSIAEKKVTSRVATAACTVTFSDETAVRLVAENQMKKGDVLAVARVAGIMAAKRTAELIPLCHPVAISRVTVEVEPAAGTAAIEIRATVACDGKTGVEMEALTAASTAALTVYDMCKAVDKGMRIEGLRVVLKDGGRSGRWEME
ncbi:moaC family protein [Hirsutella rhossiliensis]|uniref:Molybdenum cofactor biosynthesis protein 1 n=1 Tax=Hirsutella rhossiliensis TaxID=111463 RepID=A0A9P8MY43_9HYPO|nr:moaC family domain-containing protein [Hirsutella rhossiliensis]KAH0963097.1 moaC family domain-containing protein [Hirsutella rhossiliensis]